MTITALKPAVKTPGRWNIFVDGVYSFSLSDDQVLQAKVKVGLELTEETLAALKDESILGKAYARALDLILRRWRSRRELEEYARRKEWAEAITSQVIARLEARGYVNDQRFAESWVRSRNAVKPTSRRKLELELRQKGIAAELIQQVLSDSGEHNESSMLHRLVVKKKKRYPDDQKLMAYLARQGFSFDDIKQAIKEEVSSSE